MGIEIFWVTDSGGKESVHRNGKGLSLKDSYLGHMELRGEGWVGVTANGKEMGPFGYAKARRELTKIVLEENK